MPVIKFLALIAVIAFVWLGIVNVFYSYGSVAGVTCLISAVVIGRYLSKSTLAKIKAKRLSQQG